MGAGAARSAVGKYVPKVQVESRAWEAGAGTNPAGLLSRVDSPSQNASGTIERRRGAGGGDPSQGAALFDGHAAERPQSGTGDFSFFRCDGRVELARSARTLEEVARF